MTTQYASLPYGIEEYGVPPPAVQGPGGGHYDYVIEGSSSNDLHVKRKMTDRLWIAAFVVCILSLFGSLLGNVFKGSPGSLGHLRNYQGLSCGWDRKVEHLPYLYIPLDPRNGKSLILYKNRGMCVARCPDAVDVAARGYISIPETSLLQDKQKEAYVSVLHSIRSPLYSTKLSNDILCLPEHPILIDEMKLIINDLYKNGNLKLISSGIYHSLPLLIGMAIASTILSYCLFGASLPIPGSIIGIMLISTISMMTILGCKFIYRGTIGGTDGGTIGGIGGGTDGGTGGTTGGTTSGHYGYGDDFGSGGIGVIEPSQLLIFSGCGILLLSIITTVMTLTNLRNLSNASLLAHAIAQCSNRFASGSGIYPLLQIFMFFISLVGIISTLLITSQFIKQNQSTETSLDPNGGINITTLERNIYQPYGSNLQTIFIIFITIWSLESILTLSKFISSFTTTHRYFKKSQSPSSINPGGQSMNPAGLSMNPAGSSMNAGSSREPIHALLISYQYYVGSLSLFSILRFLTRPIRLLTMTTTSSRYQTDQLDQTTGGGATGGTGGVGLIGGPFSTQQRVNDHIQNSVFCELVLSGNGLRKALLSSSTRLRSTPYEALAGSINLISLLTWSYGLFIFTCVFFMASTFLHSLQDNNQISFIGSPILSAFIIASISTYISIIPWSAMETSVDSILYSALLEMEAPPTTLDYNMPHGNPQITCPTPFIKVIDEIGQQMSSN